MAADDLDTVTLRVQQRNGADISSVVFGGLDLRAPRFENCSAKDADMGGSKCGNASLCGSALTEANRRGADFNETDLRSADLKRKGLHVLD